VDFILKDLLRHFYGLRDACALGTLKQGSRYLIGILLEFGILPEFVKSHNVAAFLLEFSNRAKPCMAGNCLRLVSSVYISYKIAVVR
jgi:hypothetical protein